LILVVGNYFADRETLKAIIEERGYRVITVETGSEALARVKEKHFGIIFLDIRLPDTDGAQIFEQVKVIDPEVAVIMMTGYSKEEVVRMAISQGAYTCIYKPFDIEKILTLVGEISQQRSR
ncbi:unnamed protein product, partial [marine sediment metagenome]